MAKKQKTKKVKRCVEMFTDELSIVTRGANGYQEFLMVKSEDGEGDIGQIVVEETEKAVPGKDASREAKEKAQKARAAKYGIEILTKGSALSYPAGAPTTERLYGDPVNLKYPLAYEGDTKPDPARTRNAIARFKQNYSAYSEGSSQARVYERIVRAALSAGIKVTFDPKDPVDSKLPGDLKTRLQKSADVPSTDPENADSDAADSQDEQTAGEWLDGIKKSLEPTDDDKWLEMAKSALEPAAGNQESGSEENTGQTEDEPAPVAEPVNKSDDPKLKEIMEALKKESMQKDKTIDKLEKTVTKLEAEIARLNTSIGSTQSMIPGEINIDTDHEPDDERNASIDLSPEL